MTTNPNAIALLKKQHKEVKSLFKQIEEASAFSKKEKLFEELANNLAAHATIEEKIFYPAAYAKATKELLEEAVEEHLAIKRLIADLLEMEPDDRNFDAKITVLREQVEHHVEEEEDDLFKKVEKELEEETLSELGVQMKKRFDQAMQGEPKDKVPEETEEAAPLPTTKSQSHRDAGGKWGGP